MTTDFHVYMYPNTRGKLFVGPNECGFEHPTAVYLMPIPKTRSTLIRNPEITLALPCALCFRIDIMLSPVLF